MGKSPWGSWYSPNQTCFCTVDHTRRAIWMSPMCVPNPCMYEKNKGINGSSLFKIQPHVCSITHLSYFIKIRQLSCSSNSTSSNVPCRCSHSLFNKIIYIINKTQLNSPNNIKTKLHQNYKKKNYKSSWSLHGWKIWQWNFAMWMIWEDDHWIEILQKKKKKG